MCTIGPTRMTTEGILARLQSPDTDHPNARGQLGAARGALVGVLLGGALWIVVLAFVLPRFIQ